nr:MAG TPA: hypothetical protein [Caudoviricetes sp.]
MKEKLKEKVKNIYENYGGVIIVTGSLFGAYLLGVTVGSKITELQINNGLNKVFKIKPEVETLMLEGLEELKKK